jgi:hypothetical protein
MLVPVNSSSGISGALGSSGLAAACKAVNSGSIPDSASTIMKILKSNEYKKK